MTSGKVDIYQLSSKSLSCDRNHDQFLPQPLGYPAWSISKSASDCLIKSRSDWQAPIRARFWAPVNLGIAIAARIPIITITTISSIRVKPFCLSFYPPRFNIIANPIPNWLKS